MKIVSTFTSVESMGVLYEVRVDEQVTWSKFIAFGHTKERRAGGALFQAAAREQDAVADAARSAVMRLAQETT